MQETSEQRNSSTLKKLVLSTLVALCYGSGIAFAAAALSLSGPTFSSPKTLASGFSLHAFRLPQMEKKVLSVAFNLPALAHKTVTLSHAAVASLPTDLASGITISDTLPELAYISPVENFALPHPAILKPETITLAIPGTENREIGVAGVSLLPEGFTPSAYVPHVFTKTAFAPETLSFFIPKIGDIKTPKVEVAFLPKTSREGMVLGVSTTAQELASATKKKTLPFLDRISLSLFCTIAGASNGLDTSRCNYDAIASGQIAFAPSAPVAPLATLTPTAPSAPVAPQVISSPVSGSSPSPVYITNYVTKYVPVPGPAGRDGKDGKNGSDGVTTINNVQAPSAIGSYIIPSYSSPSTAIGISTISYLKDTTIETPGISGGTALNLVLTTPMLKDASFSGLSVFNGAATFNGSTIFGGSVTANTITATSSVITNATSTNAYIANLSAASSTLTDAVIENATSTNIFSANGTFLTASTTNLFAQNLSVGTTSANSIVLSNDLTVGGTTTLATTTVTDFTASTASTTNLVATNATSTNFFANLLSAVTAVFTDFSATNATTTNLVAINATTTNGTIDNLFSTNAVLTNATSTFFAAVNASTTNATSTNLVATNATSTNLFASLLNAATGAFTDLTSANATTTNLVATNATSTNLFTTIFSAVTGSFTNLIAGTSTLATTTVNGFLTINGNTSIDNGGTLTVGDKVIAPGEIGAGTSTPSGKISIQNTNPNQVAFLVYGTSSQVAPLIDVFDNPTSNTRIFSISATGTLFAPAATITDLVATNATTTNFFTNLFSAVTGSFTNLSTTNATSTNATSTNLFSTNAVLTNATSTFFAAVNASTTNATSSYAYITNLVAGSSTLSDALLTRSTTTDAYITRLVAASSTLTDAIVTTLNATNATFANATSTNLVATNATSTNLFANVGNFLSSIINTLTAGSITATSSLTSNGTLNVTGQTTLATASSTGLTATNLYSTTGTIANLASTNIVTTNATATNASTTNLTATNFWSTLSSIVTANVTHLVATNATTTNASTTNGTVTNLWSTLANIVTGNFTDLVATNATTTNASTTNGTITNLWSTAGSITNLTNTNATSSNLYAVLLNAGTTTLATTTISTLTVTGQTTLATASSTGLTVSGNTFVTGTTTLATTTLAQTNVAGDILPTTDISRSLGSNVLRFLNLFTQNIFATSSVITNATSTNFFATQVSGTNGYFTGGLGVGVATTTPGALQTSGDAYIGGSLTVAGSLTSSITNGQIQFLATPFGTNINEGTVYINPPSAGTNNVLLGLAVNGTEKARIDAEGDVQIVGTFNSTNTSGTNNLSGNFSVGKNVTLGTNASNTITFNGSIASPIIPDADATYDIGSPTHRFGTLYVTGSNIANLAIDGVSTSTFLINSDNATFDTEDSMLEFSRGSSTPNARIKWNSTLKQFEFNNFPVSFANSVTVAGTGTSTVAGLLNLTGTPAGTGLGQGSLFINPGSGSTDYTLLGIGVNGVERFRVDAEGDTTIQASLGIANSLYNISLDTLTVNDKLQVNGNEIKDSTGNTRIAIGSTNTLTGNVGITGALNASSTLAVTGATTLYGTLNVNGQTTLATASSTGLTVSGNTFVTGTTTLATTTATAITATGQATLATASSTGLTATNFWSTLSSIVTANVTHLVATNATTTNASTTNGTVTNLWSTLANLTTAIVTNLTATNATTTNATTTGLFAVTGTSTLATTTASKLTVTGQTTLATASSTGLTVSGNTFVTGTTTLATTTATAITATGQATLATASSTGLTATSLYFTSATGTNVALSGYLNASGTLAVTGQSSFFNTLNVAADILPTTTNTRSLGTNALRFLNTFTQNLFATSSVITNATSTNLFAAVGNFLTSSINTLTGGTITATSSLSSQGTLSVTGTSTLATTTATTLTVSGQTTLATASSTGLTATNLYSTTGTVANLTNTNSTSTGFFAVTGTSTLATTTISSLTTTNETVTNSTITNASTTNLTVSNNAYFAGSGIWNSSGNVGIGTTTSTSKLHVNGGNITLDGGTFNVKPSSGFSTVIDGNLLQARAGSYLTFVNNRFQMANTVNGGVEFATGVSTSTRMVIDNLGNVGIGTTTPGSLLSVQGNGYFGGNLTATGTLNVSGQTTLATASSTGLTVSGNTFVTGTTTLATTTLSQLTASGMILASSGNPGASGYMFSGATNTGLGYNGSYMYTGHAGTGYTYWMPNVFAGISSVVFGWGPNTNIGAALDTGLARNAAGVVEINNGTAGTYRDLIARAITSTGTSTFATTTATTLTVSGQTTLANASTTGLTASNFYSTNASTTNLSVSGESSFMGGVGVGTSSSGIAGKINFLGGAYLDSATVIGGGQNDLTISSPDYLNLIGNFMIQFSSQSKFTASTLFTDNILAKFGQDNDYSIGYSSTRDSLQIMDGATINNNVRLALNRNGNISIGTTTSSARLSIMQSYGSTTPLFDVATTTSAGFATSSLFTVLASGNVGIGTSSPDSLLSVQGNAYIGGNVTATGTLNVSGQTTLGTASSTGLTVTDSAFLATGSGAVGIGTTSLSTYALNIASPTGSTGYIRALRNNTGSIDFLVDAFGVTSVRGSGFGNTSLTVNTGATSTSGIVVKGIAAQAADLQKWVDSANNVLANITAAGYLGIGTSTPGSLLSVQGNGYFGGTITATGTITSQSGSNFITVDSANSKIRLFNSGVEDLSLTAITNGLGVNGIITASSTITSQGSLVSSADASNSGLGAGTVDLWSSSGNPSYVAFSERSVGNRGIFGFGAGSGDLVYRQGATTMANGTEVFRISSAGNVGIGSSTPAAKLGVTGDAYIGGNLTATGTLNITGATTLSSILSVTGTTTLATTTADTLSVGPSAGLQGLFTVGGTYNTTNSSAIVFNQILKSNVTGQQNIITAQSQVQPTGASVSAIYGILNLPTLASSSAPVTNVFANYARIDATANYSGLLSNGYDFAAGNPSNASANPYTLFAQFMGETITNGNGTTTGTVTNYGIKLNGNTAAATGTATLTNYGIFNTVPSGSPTAGTNNNYGLYITGNGGTATVNGTVNNYSFYNNSTANSYFAGNVGVGTTSPAYKLTIESNGVVGGILVNDSNISQASPVVSVIGRRDTTNISQTFSGGLALAKWSSSTPTTSGERIGTVYFGGSYDGTASGINYAATISGLADGAFSSTTSMPTALAFYTGSSGNVLGIANGTPYGTERLRITSGGNVGIGTTTPGSLLSVQGDAYIGGNLTATGTLTVSGTASSSIMGALGIGIASPSSSNLHIHNSSAATILKLTNSSSGSGAQDGLSIALLTGTADSQLWNYENGYMRFATNNAERMRIDASGNVGIGTTTPISVFAVASSTASGTSSLFSIGTTSPIVNILANNFVQLGLGSVIGVQGAGSSATFNGIGTLNNTGLRTGMYVSGDDIYFKGNGNGSLTSGDQARFVNQGGLRIASGNYFGWGSGDVTTANDTALSRISAGKIGIGTGAAGSFTGSLAVGNVAVGTSTGPAKLSVQGDYGGTATLFDVATTTSSAFATSSLFTVLANGKVGIGTSSPVQLLSVGSSGGISAVFTGSVGIGRSSPSYPLDVNGYARVTSGLILNGGDPNTALVVNGGAQYASASYALTNYGNSTFALLNRNAGSATYQALDFSTVDSGGNNAYAGATIKGLFSGLGTGAISGSLSFSTNNNSTGTTERMRIDSSGNVGIGTTSPTSSLFVQANATVNPFAVASSSGSTLLQVLSDGTVQWGSGESGTPTALTLRGAAGGGTDITGADITFDASNGTGAGSSGDFVFRTASSASGTYVPALDAIATTTSTGVISSKSWNHTVTSSGSNRILIVAISASLVAESVTSAVTYGGQAMTKVASSTQSNRSISMWYLLNPPTGTNTVVASTTIGSSNPGVVFASLSYTDVNQSVPFGTFSTANVTGGVSITTSVTPAINNVIISVVTNDGGGTWTAGSGQSLQYSAGAGASGGVMTGAGATLTATTTSSTATSWTVSTNSNLSIVSIPLKGAVVTGSNALTLSEALRIKSSGYVGIGTTTPATKLQVAGDIRVGTTGTNGCVQGYGGATLTGTCSSDERLKDNVTDINDVLDRFSQLRVINYNWNKTANTLYHNDMNSIQTGYLAQNVEALFPELVTVNKEGYKQVNYSAMSLYTAAAVKEFATNNRSVSMFQADEAVDYGTIVAFSTSTHAYIDKTASTTFDMVGVRKAANGDEAIGVVTTKTASTTIAGASASSTFAVPVAFSGKMVVKLSSDSADVQAGEYLTVSTTTPGAATKMTQAGRSIGQALSSGTAGGSVLVLVQLGYENVDTTGRYATTTAMLTTGNLDLNANGVAIINIKSLASASGAWSISEDGRIIAKVLCLDDVCIDKNTLTNILNSTGQTGVVAGTSTSSTGTTGDTSTTTASTSADASSTSASTYTTTTDTGSSTPTGTATDTASGGTTSTSSTDTSSSTPTTTTDTSSATTTDTATTTADTTTVTEPSPTTTTDTSSTAPADTTTTTDTTTTAPTDTTTTASTDTTASTTP